MIVAWHCNYIYTACHGGIFPGTLQTDKGVGHTYIDLLPGTYIFWQWMRAGANLERLCSRTEIWRGDDFSKWTFGFSGKREGWEDNGTWAQRQPSITNHRAAAALFPELLETFVDYLLLVFTVSCMYTSVLGAYQSEPWEDKYLLSSFRNIFRPTQPNPTKRGRIQIFCADNFIIIIFILYFHVHNLHSTIFGLKKTSSCYN